MEVTSNRKRDDAHRLYRSLAGRSYPMTRKWETGKMFVEPQPGSGLDKVAPAYLVRRLLGWVAKRESGGEPQAPVQQQSSATPATEPGPAKPDHAG
jgi:hypothetical protein